MAIVPRKPYYSSLPEALQTYIGNIRIFSANATKDLFDNFLTSHGEDHGQRTMEYVNSITETCIPENTMSDIEKYVLSCAVYLHDIGMQDSEEGGSEFSRRRSIHAKLSAARIRDKKSTGLIPDQYREAIARVVEGHQENIFNNLEYWNYDLGNELLRLDLCAVILQLADELDCTFDRINVDRLKFVKISPENLVHHYLHLSVKACRIMASPTGQPEIRIALFYPPNTTNDLKKAIKFHWDKRIWNTVGITNAVLSKYGMKNLADATIIETDEISSLPEIPHEVGELIKKKSQEFGLHIIEHEARSLIESKELLGLVSLIGGLNQNTSAYIISKLPIIDNILATMLKIEDIPETFEFPACELPQMAARYIDVLKDNNSKIEIRFACANLLSKMRFPEYIFGELAKLVLFGECKVSQLALQALVGKPLRPPFPLSWKMELDKYISGSSSDGKQNGKKMKFTSEIQLTEFLIALAMKHKYEEIRAASIEYLNTHVAMGSAEYKIIAAIIEIGSKDDSQIVLNSCVRFLQAQKSKLAYNGCKMLLKRIIDKFGGAELLFWFIFNPLGDGPNEMLEFIESENVNIRREACSSLLIASNYHLHRTHGSRWMDAISIFDKLQKDQDETIRNLAKRGSRTLTLRMKLEADPYNQELNMKYFKVLNPQIITLPGGKITIKEEPLD